MDSGQADRVFTVRIEAVNKDICTEERKEMSISVRTYFKNI